MFQQFSLHPVLVYLGNLIYSKVKFFNLQMTKFCLIQREINFVEIFPYQLYTNE